MFTIIGNQLNVVDWPPERSTSYAVQFIIRLTGTNQFPTGYKLIEMLKLAN